MSEKTSDFNPGMIANTIFSFSQHLAENPPHYDDWDAKSVLEMLYVTYGEYKRIDSEYARAELEVLGDFGHHVRRAYSGVPVHEVGVAADEAVCGGNCSLRCFAIVRLLNKSMSDILKCATKHYTVVINPRNSG